MTSIPPGSRTTRAARATRTRSAASLPWRRSPPPPRAVISQALEHWEAAVAVSPQDPRCSRACPWRRTCAGAPSSRWRRAARCSGSTRPPARRRAAGDDLRWLSRILWWAGQGMEAAAVGDMAIATLEAFPDSRELAMALSGRSQLAMLAWEGERAIELGHARDRGWPGASTTGDGRARAHERRHGAARQPRSRTGRRAARGGVHARARDRLRRSCRARADQPRCRHAGQDAARQRRARARAAPSPASASWTATCSTRSACARTCGCCAATGTRRRPMRAPRWISASSPASACARR